MIEKAPALTTPLVQVKKLSVAFRAGGVERCCNTGLPLWAVFSRRNEAQAWF